MLIYISLPISGSQFDACQARARRIQELLANLGHRTVTPFDACSEPRKPYAYYMGRDIQALLGCDAIFLLSGWSESRSCQLEWRCAQIYNKQVFHHLNEIPHEQDSDP